MSNVVKATANVLAKEIASRNQLNVEELSIMIEQQIKTGIMEMASEMLSDTERKYMELIAVQAKAHGTKEYVKIGYKLALMKANVKQLNLLRASLERNDRYQKLKTFVIEQFGEEALIKFNNTLQ